MVLDYLKDEPFVGEDLYIFRAENVQEILSWQGEDNSSLGEYLTGLIENPDVGEECKNCDFEGCFL